ncbi:hypothetical protein EDB89DRAFT_2162752 [Lactarius sanguifluus]|nr:hypothetical protein EDB89DRAFT_2162752 [Lactarius sanguifluus]
MRSRPKTNVGYAPGHPLELRRTSKEMRFDKRNALFGIRTFSGYFYDNRRRGHQRARVWTVFLVGGLVSPKLLQKGAPALRRRVTFLTSVTWDPDCDGLDATTTIMLRGHGRRPLQGFRKRNASLLAANNGHDGDDDDGDHVNHEETTTLTEPTMTAVTTVAAVHMIISSLSLPFKTSVPMVCHKYVMTLSSFGLRYIRAKHVSMRSGVQFGMTLGDGRRRGHRRAVRNTVHGCFGGSRPPYYGQYTHDDNRRRHQRPQYDCHDDHNHKATMKYEDDGNEGFAGIPFHAWRGHVIILSAYKSMLFYDESSLPPSASIDHISLRERQALFSVATEFVGGLMIGIEGEYSIRLVYFPSFCTREPWHFDDDASHERPSRHQLWTRDGSLTVVVVIIVIIVNGEATTSDNEVTKTMYFGHGQHPGHDGDDDNGDHVNSEEQRRRQPQRCTSLFWGTRALLFLHSILNKSAIAISPVLLLCGFPPSRLQWSHMFRRVGEHDRHPGHILPSIARWVFFHKQSPCASRGSAIREPRHSNDDASHGRRGYLTSAPSDPNCDGPNAVTNNLDLDDQAIPGRGGRATTTTRVAGWLVKASDEDATTTTMRRLGDGLAGRSLHKEHKYNSRKPEAFHAWKGHVTILSAYKTVFSDASLLLPHLPSRFFHHLRAPSTAKSSPKKGNTLI